MVWLYGVLLEADAALLASSVRRHRRLLLHFRDELRERHILVVLVLRLLWLVRLVVRLLEGDVFKKRGHLWNHSRTQ